MHKRGIKIQVCAFLTSALDEEKCSTSRPGRITPAKILRYKLNWKLDWILELVYRFGEDINFFPPWISNSKSSSPYPSHYSTHAFRLPHA